MDTSIAKYSQWYLQVRQLSSNASNDSLHTSEYRRIIGKVWFFSEFMFFVWNEFVQRVPLIFWSQSYRQFLVHVYLLQFLKYSSFVYSWMPLCTGIFNKIRKIFPCACRGTRIFFAFYQKFTCREQPWVYITVLLEKLEKTNRPLLETGTDDAIAYKRFIWCNSNFLMFIEKIKIMLFSPTIGFEHFVFGVVWNKMHDLKLGDICHLEKLTLVILVEFLCAFFRTRTSVWKTYAL